MMLLTGCGAIVVPREGFDPPFDEEVLESLLGSTRNEVEEQLGRPLFMGYKEDKSYFVYGGHIDTTGMIVGVPTFPIWSNESICSLLEFGADERLTRYETLGGSGVYILPIGGVGDAPENCKEAFWSKDELAELEQIHIENLEKRAQRGDPEAMYEYAVTLRSNRPSDAFKWFCEAAHRGLATARNTLGDYYRWGGSVVPHDPVIALFWYTLALDGNGTRASNRRASVKRTSVKKTMAPEQIAEAERLVAEWEPSPAECVVEAAKSEN